MGSLPEIRSIFARVVDPGEEVFTKLFSGESFCLEKINSFGHVTTEGKWYKQKEDEWVILLKGDAQLQFDQGVLKLCEGEYVMIPALVRHRVSVVSDDAVWLALHASKALKHC